MTQNNSRNNGARRPVQPGTAKAEAKAAGAALPEDHKITLEETPGWKHLIKISDLDAIAQLELLDALQDLEMDDAEEGAEVKVPLKKLANFVRYVADNIAVDREAFLKWSAGKGGYQRTIELVMAYGNALGE